MEAKRLLNEALKILRMIRVSEDGVDCMYVAKSNIRAAIAQLNAAEKAEVKDDG